MKNETYKFYIDDELEGVFSSLSEIASYMRLPKKVITKIINGEYTDTHENFHNMLIYREYSPSEFQEELASMYKKE